MKAIYNEELEKDIKIIINETKNKNQLIEILNNKYYETNYPGYKYTIGLYNHDINEFIDAASENYLPALIILCELYLEKIFYETIQTRVNFYLPDYFNNLKSDPYGEFLLAKYAMIRCILMEEEHKYFPQALSLMKHSAKKGNEKAKRFMEDIF